MMRIENGCLERLVDGEWIRGDFVGSRSLCEWCDPPESCNKRGGSFQIVR